MSKEDLKVIACILLLFATPISIVGIAHHFLASKDNVIYEKQGSVFFYRAGAKFVRLNDGWLIISTECHGMSFVQDPDWTMPGEVTRKKNDNEKQEK